MEILVKGTEELVVNQVVRAIRKHPHPVILLSLAFAMGLVLGHLVGDHAPNGWVSDVTMIMIIVIIWLYERRKEQAMVARLQVIKLMNHHVRNALQIMVCSSDDGFKQEHVALVKEATGRIEWALQEVLPGDGIDVSVPQAVRSPFGPDGQAN